MRREEIDGTKGEGNEGEERKKKGENGMGWREGRGGKENVTGELEGID